MARNALTLAEYQALVGTEVGVSDWIEVDQAKINAFADATGDHQFIHVDPERAKMTPFGTTIAHGYLTLSLLPVMRYSPKGENPTERTALRWPVYSRISLPFRSYSRATLSE